MHFRPRNENVSNILAHWARGPVLLRCRVRGRHFGIGLAALLRFGGHALRSLGKACEAVAPWQLNLPDFVKLDLRGKRIHTTAGSAEERETPLQSVQRANSTILIHGAQGERAFSWLIDEVSGDGTLSVAGHGQGVTVFTVCTAVDKL